MSLVSRQIAVVSLGLIAIACGNPDPEEPSASSPSLIPPRGIILISIDTLRADRLGAYGYELETSPNFDQLAQRGVLFERAIAQYPSTLTSHMTLFTGFYPQEHRVLPPSTVLAESIETIPERFLAHGFRTAGHTEGGFVAGGFGFNRGFEQFTDTAYSSDTDIERTFDRGLEFLRELGPEERFFLFLHSYSVHDPYDPPQAFREKFWQGEPPETFESSGENLRLVNRGELELSDEGLAYFEAMYDASVSYVDDVLGRFVAEIEALGLLSETVLVLTSDHGEEFMEHGRMAHTQVYPESIEVPLLIVRPGVASGRSIPTLVELVDLAPTLYELAGIPLPASISGESLVSLIQGSSRSGETREAYAEVLDEEYVYTLLTQKQDRLYQLVMAEPEFDPTGTWILGSVTIDTDQPTLRFDAHSFHEPRTVRVRAAGETVDEFEIGPDWTPITIELPDVSGIQSVTLEADGCRSPAEVGQGDDDRCLSFQLRDFRPLRFELYDLATDRSAQVDIYREEPSLRKALRNRLEGLDWDGLEAGGVKTLTAEDEATLKALGYLD
jgi:arylsulfatase A-like enzyme